MQKEGGEPIDIEVFFDGLQVQSVTGLGNIGEANNIYIERWIGSNIADVYIPTDNNGVPKVTYNPTDVIITILVSKKNNNVQETKKDFINYIQGITILTETYRGIQSKLIFMGSTEHIKELYSNNNLSFLQFSCKFQKINSIDVIL